MTVDRPWYLGLPRNCRVRLLMNTHTARPTLLLRRKFTQGLIRTGKK